MSAGMTVQVSKADYDKWQARDAKAKLSARKASVKNLIYVEKAKAAKIVVTKAEVDARIAADDAKKVTEVAQVSDADTGTDGKKEEIATLVDRAVRAN